MKVCNVYELLFIDAKNTTLSFSSLSITACVCSVLLRNPREVVNFTVSLFKIEKGEKKEDECLAGRAYFRVRRYSDCQCRYYLFRAYGRATRASTVS